MIFLKCGGKSKETQQGIVLSRKEIKDKTFKDIRKLSRGSLVVLCRSQRAAVVHIYQPAFLLEEKNIKLEGGEYIMLEKHILI